MGKSRSDQATGGRPDTAKDREAQEANHAMRRDERRRGGDRGDHVADVAWTNTPLYQSERPGSASEKEDELPDEARREEARRRTGGKS